MMTNQPLVPTKAAPQPAAPSIAGATAQPPTPPGGNQDPTPEWDETFDSEITDIQRRQVGDPITGERDNLIGLAFSGGGIRSATFGLGVLEALKHLDLLKRVHYLSTVSGGGYIGAWLSANTKRDKKWLSPETDWQKSIAHLRRYSNYLSPELGFFSADTWSMVLVWLRNTLLVQTTVILAIATVLTVPRLLAPLFQAWPDAGNARWATILLFLFAVAGIAGNEIRVISSSRRVKFLNANSWPLGVGLCAVCAVVVAGLWWYFDFHPFQEGPVDVLPSLLIALFLVLAAFCLLPFAVQLVKLGHGGPNAPTEINYTQGYVQVTVVLPIMASCFLVGAILWGETVRPIQPGDGTVSLATLNTFGGFFKTAVRYWPFPLAVVFCSIALLSFCTVLSFEKQTEDATRETGSELGAAPARLDRRKTAAGAGAALLATLMCVVVLHALLSVIMLLLHGWHRNGGGLEQAFVWAPTLVLFAFSLTIIVLIGMMGRQWTEGVREWWSRLGAWLSIYGSAWMIITIVAVYGPQWVYTLFRDYQAASLTGLAGWIGTVAAGLVAGRSDSTGGQTSAGATSKPNMIMKWLAAIAPFAFIAVLLIGVATGIDYIVWDNTGQTWWTIGRGAPQSGFFRLSSYVFGGCVVALLIMAFRIDINEFSLSAFYRSRLVRCYLGATRPAEKRRPQNFTGFDDDDDIPLAKLVDPASDAVGPLHIINCALNLGGSSDLALHTRHSASFTLSPLNCGSDYQSRTLDGKKHELGYIPTSEYGGTAGAPTLGQAISVSGAAASPNMGYHTSPVVAFLLTVFNVRLGWWFPNPRPGGADVIDAKGSGESSKGAASPDSKAVARPSPHFSLRYLFAELFGLADDKSNFLMISDGGHFENLAAYELVRRRCKVIIISDAEADPALTFEGLGTLIRMCDVDFGAKIDLDVGSIRLGQRGGLWSTNRCAVGKIVYADKGKGEAKGIVIYLKASMTGHEDSATLQYKASHPDFPHESTGDQFYREDQFESYRRLGYDVTRRTFATALGEHSLPEFNANRPSGESELTVLSLATKLEATCSPGLENISRFTEHSERLMSLWERLSSNSTTLGNLDLGVVGGDHLPADWTSSFRPEFYICSEMIQFMENVYLDLNLEQTWMHPDNEGWRKMFGAWAASPSLIRTWELSHKTFGLRFQYFCNRHFKLRVDA